uniref:Embryo surrounding factor 1 brassicaceae domain-containing protein n=1 Tax=Setaria viridis TaxID=4556 RepID=A0A4U6TRE8_SETVI|nr:hypothetical protein SEVIR_7G079200v2 [Setaria viridis]
MALATRKNPIIATHENGNNQGGSGKVRANGRPVLRAEGARGYLNSARNMSSNATAVNNTSVDQSKIYVNFCFKYDCKGTPCYCCDNKKLEHCFWTEDQCLTACPACNPECPPCIDNISSQENNILVI